MAGRLVARQPDLLAWPELHDAELRLEAAEGAHAYARRRYLLAPHGFREARLKALKDATNDCLRAQLEVHRLSGGGAS